VAAQADRLGRMQLAIAILQREIEQAVPRKILGDEMHVFASFIGAPQYVEFTHIGHRSQRSNLKRVAFICQNKQLIRRTWPVLDIPTRANHQDTVLLEQLASCQFAYMSKQKQLFEEWHASTKITDSKIPDNIPIAIQFNMRMDPWGKASFLWLLPGGRYVP
jgi:general secretion pathway protein J